MKALSFRNLGSLISFAPSDFEIQVPRFLISAGLRGVQGGQLYRARAGGGRRF
jgi:hypothetical protein